MKANPLDLLVDYGAALHVKSTIRSARARLRCEELIDGRSTPCHRIYVQAEDMCVTCAARDAMLPALRAAHASVLYARRRVTPASRQAIHSWLGPGHTGA